MNKILLLILGLILSAVPVKAGQWIYVEGSDTNPQSGQNPAGLFYVQMTTNNTMTFIFAALAVFDLPSNGIGAGVFLGNQPGGVGKITEGYYAADYLPANADAMMINGIGSLSQPAGTPLFSVQKQAFAPGTIYLQNYRVAVYLDNEYGPSDQRILGVIGEVATNLTTQINAVSNSLSAEMLSISNLLATQNVTTSNVLSGQITTLSNLNATQISSLSNQLLIVNGQVTTNTANIAALQSQLALLTAQYNNLSNTVANIPAPVDYTPQINSLQGQINSVNDSLNAKTSGVLGGSTWNDVVSFMGLGLGASGTVMQGTKLLNGGGSGATGGSIDTPVNEARPGYFDK